MPIDYDALMATQVHDESCEYNDKDALLYALAVGFGSNPLDGKELPYVFEGASLKTVPTLASMLLPSTFLDDYKSASHRNALRFNQRASSRKGPQKGL